MDAGQSIASVEKRLAHLPPLAFPHPGTGQPVTPEVAAG
jgi:hypothetical protein